MNLRAPAQVGFRVSIAVVLVTTVLLMAAATIGIVVVVGGDASKKNAQTMFHRSAESVSEGLEDLINNPQNLLLSTAADRDALAPIEGSGRFHPLFPLLHSMLRTAPSLLSVSLASSGGELLQLVRAPGPAAHHLTPPPQTRYLLRVISGVGSLRSQTWTFLGETGKSLGQQWDPLLDWAPASSSWFQNAVSAQGNLVSASQRLDEVTSTTLSVAVPNLRRVLSVEVDLREIQDLVDRQDVSERGSLVVADSHDTVIARTKVQEAEPTGFQTTVTHTVGGENYSVVVTAPRGNFDVEFRTMELSVVGATALLLLLLVPLTLVFTKRLTRIITVLSDDIERVCRMDFSGEAPQGSRVRELATLARGFATMKSTLSGETKVLADAQLKLKKIVETGIALSTEKDSNALCQLILDTAKDLTDADGGTLYLLNHDDSFLDFNIMLNDTLGTRFGGTSDLPIPQGLKVKLYKDDGGENHNNVASHAFLTGETVNIVDAYNDNRFDFSGTKKFDEANGYRSQSFLTVPLIPMGGEVLGALQLINAKAPDGVTNVPFTRDMQDFVEALAASAATAIYNNQLVDELKQALSDLDQLFNAIIDVINGAIGRKSPYTGGHCERVPIIAAALAKATSDVKKGPLAGFSLDEKELREFELAAKLHDVGKVTTPEYVVDKSTKLETIYNRIHEVRTRFEVLYRDAIIRRHEAVLGEKKTAKAADKELAAFKAVLEEEWAFLAATNLGGEFLSPDKVERVKAIGSRTWLRYFDDRLGLSWEEEFRLAHIEGLGGTKPTLPVQETLLADKPIHVFPRTVAFEEAYKTVLGSPYPFKTPVPDVLFNQGELYNLAIGRGTLTNEEHFKIKEHVMQSVYMLDRLPWPKGLELVPVIAGEHHETLVGTGYPYQRKAEDLSMQSRILTVADIFEALTASDRPYKKPKMLSEAVKVLYFFKKDKHIDSDLFDLFLTSGVYLDYAKKYLRADQLDEVDIKPYLGPLPA